MVLGALLGPMNGSVGASVLGLSRVVAPRLDRARRAGGDARRRNRGRSTLGVLVPPSLVLILLGDAMLSAHTTAVTATGRSDRVINTQDIFHAALVPAGIFLLLCFALAWFAGRGQPLSPAPRERPAAQQIVLAALALAALLVLLGGVATGYFYAVEAAAMGAFALLSGGLISGHLRGPVLRELLHDAIAITGALFSLLLAATTFTLVLRLLGTDRLVITWSPPFRAAMSRAVAVVLGVIGLCAFVLDAFEIIFVIVPIVIPPLLIRVADARWVAVLVLLTLAIELPAAAVRLCADDGAGRGKKSGAVSAVRDARWCPFLLAQWLLLIVVLLVPELVHVGENAAENTRLPAAPISDADIDKRMREIAPPPPPPPEFK